MEQELRNELLSIVNSYLNYEEVARITKALNIATSLHKCQTRDSGDPYIVHPLTVACTVANMKLDCDTICAALLHDTIEDTPYSLENIEDEFNKDVAILVDGVTKISRLKFSNKQEQILANTRKIINGLRVDVRIIYIKLADRLHNMRTLSYKKYEKQKANAEETMKIFVPLANAIGAYHIKHQLEDISLSYIDPEGYDKTKEIYLKVKDESYKPLQEMKKEISYLLHEKAILCKIKTRIKNINGIYDKLSKGYKLDNIHDLLNLKIIVNEIDDCYRSLGYVHSLYHPYNSKFKDYICNPKTNLYQSLHTTVFGKDGRLVQTQIKTYNMDEVASYGVASYWNYEHTRESMQEELKKKTQIIKVLQDINNSFDDNEEFVNSVINELFKEKIYVYTPKGEVIELPLGATVLDFAYYIHTELANHIIGAKVNDEDVGIEHILNDNDRVYIKTTDLVTGPKEEWESILHTTRARRGLKEELRHNRTKTLSINK